MQELKDTVRQNIIQVALREFLEKGYERTSMRSIAALAGISHGNIYRYFESKDVLYQSLVERSQSKLLFLLQDILIPFNSDSDVSLQLQELAEKLASLIEDNRTNLLLLLEKGPVLRVNQLKEQVIQMITVFFKTHIGLQGPFEDDFFINLASSGIVKGFLEIARSENDKDWSVRNLRLLVQYHLFGLSNFSG